MSNMAEQKKNWDLRNPAEVREFLKTQDAGNGMKCTHFFRDTGESIPIDAVSDWEVMQFVFNKLCFHGLKH